MISGRASAIFSFLARSGWFLRKSASQFETDVLMTVLVSKLSARQGKIHFLNKEGACYFGTEAGRQEIRSDEFARLNGWGGLMLSSGHCWSALGRENACSSAGQVVRSYDLLILRLIWREQVACASDAPIRTIPAFPLCE